MCWFFATDFFAEELGNLCLTKIQKVDDSNTQVCNNDTGLISVLLPVRCIPVLIYSGSGELLVIDTCSYLSLVCLRIIMLGQYRLVVLSKLYTYLPVQVGQFSTSTVVQGPFYSTRPWSRAPLFPSHPSTPPPFD